MKRLTILAPIVVWMLGVPDVSLGQEKGLGLGVIIGEPTGISAKAWVSEKGAIDAGVAWSFREKGKFHLHADHLWHFPHNVLSPQRIIFYAGVGGRFAVGRGDGIFGVRIPLGVLWLPRGAPMDVFLELAPIFDLIPATELSANAGIGVRYFFPSY
jgi:hypothetical protein